MRKMTSTCSDGKVDGGDVPQDQVGRRLQFFLFFISEAEKGVEDPSEVLRSVVGDEP
jgi:hypothetical protein